MNAWDKPPWRKRSQPFNSFRFSTLVMSFSCVSAVDVCDVWFSVLFTFTGLTQFVQFARRHVYDAWFLVPIQLATASPPQHTKHSVGFTGLAVWVYATLAVLGGWVGSLARMCTCLASKCWLFLVLGLTNLLEDTLHFQFCNTGRLPVISTTMTYLMFLVFSTVCYLTDVAGVLSWKQTAFQVSLFLLSLVVC